MQKNGSIHPACVSCKHQRKKCSLNCPLAPHFPPEKTPKFKAVHKVFGPSNIQKMINKVDTDEKRVRLIESIIWEAESKQSENVEACYGAFKRLEAEVKMLKDQIANCPMCNSSGTQGSYGWVAKNNLRMVAHNNELPSMLSNLVDQPYVTHVQPLPLQRNAFQGGNLAISCQQPYYTDPSTLMSVKKPDGRLKDGTDLRWTKLADYGHDNVNSFL